MRGDLAGRWDPEAGLTLESPRPGPGPPPDTLCLLWGRLSRTRELEAAAGGARESHTELIAAAYDRLGDGVLDACHGEFALLLWNRATRRGLLARDRLGDRPVFLARRSGALYFATELRPLLAMLPSQPGPDRVAVAHWLARTAAPGGRTLHEGIERLAPGHAIALGEAGSPARRYWSPRYVAPPDVGREEAVTKIREGMSSAVDRALGGGRAGVMLSGGFDSGAIAALAAEAGEPTAYSCVFPALPELDESDRVSAVRSALALQGVQARVGGGSALAPAIRFLLEFGTPPVSANWFAWEPLMRRAAEDGIEVLLDGEGGDELFGCSPYLIADELARGRLPSAIRLTRELPGMGDRPRSRWVRRGLTHYGGRGLLPHPAHRLLRRLRGRTGPPRWMAPDLAALHRETHDPWSWKRADAPRWWSWLAHALTAAGDAMGAPDQLRRESAAAGVELRHPFRDPALIELLLRTPPRLAFDRNLDRPLAREAMAGRLPDVVRLSDRKPHFNSLLEGAFAGPDAPAVASLLADPAAEVAAYVDPAMLAQGRLPGESSLARPLSLWRIVMLEAWLRLQKGSAGPRGADRD
jgi:asparagine synthase (glutamine-hydrolysing)